MFYFALFDNNIIDTAHFTEQSAGENEKEVYASFLTRKEEVMVGLREELTDKKTPYQDLPIDYQVYESFITSMLYSNGIIIESAIDTSDATYIAWTDDEVISLNEYLNYVIAKNWIDVTKLDLSSQYSDSEENFMPNC